MTPQFGWLTASLFLAIAQIMLAAGAKRRQDGLQWAAGPRDNPPPYSGVAARLDRAEKNLFETLWIFAIALLVAHLAGRDGQLNAWGAGIYVLARCAYVPLYATGATPWRSIVWCISIAGLAMTLIALL